jgi:hypothetical protein
MSSPSRPLDSRSMVNSAPAMSVGVWPCSNKAVDVVLIGVEFARLEAFLERVENQIGAAALDLLLDGMRSRRMTWRV